ncbi:MAG: DNA primase [Flavobacteriales bacterium]|nr:DNA primase [Flavobacteriales bacterium]
MIPKQTVDEILETARVEEVVGDFVNLKKRGANLLGLCPFHNEKTPSFTVSPAKGIYKCFGCGKAGGAANFIMDHEHYTYPEALKYLADKYNIEIEEEEQSAEQIQQANEKESLFIVTQFAAEYFQQQLKETENGRAIGLSYFKERGFREETIEKFKLGYSPDEWEAFTKAALDKGYKLDYLEKTGLTIVKGEKHFDRFKGRVMFPIQNISGRVIGFGGRTLSADKKTAKYLNSPESEIYHKSRVLYGLNLAKKTIIEKDLCYLVEGYTDVISFHQNGVENVVASSGTSLTTEQIRLIKRYTPNITILFDGDTAGIKAAFRGIDMILEEGMNVKVLAFPEGEDPDSFARSKSTEELSSFLKENAQDFIRFKTSLLVSEVGKDPMKRASLIKEIVNSIALIPDPIARSVYIQESGDILDISEQALMSELNKVRRNTLSKKIQNKEREEKREDFGVTDDTTFLQEKPKPQEKPLIYQEEDIIRTLIKFGNQDVEIPKEKDDDEAIVLTVAEYVVFEMEEDNLSFTHPLFDKIYALFKTAVESETSVVENTLVSNEDKELSSFAIECLMDKYTLSINWYDKHQILTLKEEEILQKKVHRGVCSWRLTKVQQMLEDMQAALKENPDNYESIYEEISRLLQAKKALGNELGRIVLR